MSRGEPKAPSPIGSAPAPLLSTERCLFLNLADGLPRTPHGASTRSPYVGGKSLVFTPKPGNSDPSFGGKPKKTCKTKKTVRVQILNHPTFLGWHWWLNRFLPQKWARSRSISWAEAKNVPKPRVKHSCTQWQVFQISSFFDAPCAH